MIVLRRGHPVHPMTSSVAFEVMFDLEAAARGRHQGHRQGCYAPWRPPIEVFETDQALVVRAEIGGVSDEQVQVVVEGDELVIRGERTIGPLNGRRRYHESRVHYGEFAVAVHLPFPVDREAAAADYADGFLTVNLPRLAATRIAPQELDRAGGAQQGEQ